VKKINSTHSNTSEPLTTGIGYSLDFAFALHRPYTGVGHVPEKARLIKNISCNDAIEAMKKMNRF
jgi:hypothetical protein